MRACAAVPNPPLAPDTRERALTVPLITGPLHCTLCGQRRLAAGDSEINERPAWHCRCGAAGRARALLPAVNTARALCVTQVQCSRGRFRGVDPETAAACVSAANTSVGIVGQHGCRVSRTARAQALEHEIAVALQGFRGNLCIQ
jgi:hypothetical protein